MWNVEQVASWHFSQLKFHFHRSRLNMYQYAFFIVTDFISTEMHVPCHCILLWTSVNPLDFVYHRLNARVITWSWTKPTFSPSLLFEELLVIPNKVLPLAVPYSIQSFHFPTSLVTFLSFSAGWRQVGWWSRRHFGDVRANNGSGSSPLLLSIPFNRVFF